MAESKRIIICARELFDGKGRQKNRFIVVEGDRIIDVSSKGKLGDGYRAGAFVTPAFIDAHSHIGMCREGEPASEGETNDDSNQILPLHNPLNSVYLDDKAFRDAVDFGVLYSCIVPGSGNLIGGRAMIIKNWAQNRKEALLKDYGYKLALGYNPRSTTDWKGERPNTRMGIYVLLEKRFEEVLRKKARAELTREKNLIKLRKEKNDKKKKLSDEDYGEDYIGKKLIEKEFFLEFSPEEKALLEILSGKKICKVHVHKEDDILYLIELTRKYNLKVTVDHACDVHHKEIFNELAKNNIPVVYGPLGSLAYKVELKHDRYQNAKLLMDSEVFYGLMTDHPVIMTAALRDSLKFFLIQGMDEAEAISLVTYKNAKILGIDDMLGTIEPGKLASLVVWDKNPFHLGAFPKLVMAEGKIVRENS